MVAMEEILIRKNERKVTWILQYGFRPCHHSLIQSIQWLHDRGKLNLVHKHIEEYRTGSYFGI